jgi:hypothetical protein
LSVEVGARDRVAVENLPPGVLDVAVRSWSNRTELHQAKYTIGPAHSRRIEIALRPAAVEDRVDLVVRPQPAPRPGSYFGATLFQPAGEAPSLIKYTAGYAPAGNMGTTAYRFKRRAPGRYMLWMTDGEHMCLREVELKADAGEMTLDVPLDLEAGACEFVVVDADGKAAPEAVVRWFWNDEHAALGAMPYLEGVTDKDGRCVLKGMPAATHGLTFTVTAPGREAELVTATSGNAGAPAIVNVRLSAR